jgi:hypothetical protein
LLEAVTFDRTLAGARSVERLIDGADRIIDRARNLAGDE